MGALGYGLEYIGGRGTCLDGFLDQVLETGFIAGVDDYGGGFSAGFEDLAGYGVDGGGLRVWVGREGGAVSEPLSGLAGATGNDD